MKETGKLCAPLGCADRCQSVFVREADLMPFWYAVCTVCARLAVQDRRGARTQFCALTTNSTQIVAAGTTGVPPLEPIKKTPRGLVTKVVVV